MPRAKGARLSVLAPACQTPVSDLEYARAAPDAPFWGFMGAGFALVFANIGAAYGTGKSGMGISSLGVLKPELVMKSIVPVRSEPARSCGALR